MPGKKRERHKKCRHKYSLSDVQSKRVDEILKSDHWPSPEIHMVLNRAHKSAIVPQIMDALKSESRAKLLTAIFNRKTIELLQIIDHRVVDDLMKLLGEVQKSFRKTRIGRVVNDHVPRHDRRSHVQLVSSYVTTTQFRATFTRLSSLIFPPNLLTADSWAAFNHSFAHNLSALRCRGTIATRERLVAIDRIRLSDVTWLHKVPLKVKVLTIRQLFAFLANFYTNVLTNHFYSTMNYAGKIVHFRRCVWRRIERRGFEMLCVQRRLTPILPISSSGKKDDTAAATTIVDQYGCDSEVAIHKLRFLPKKTNVRPIVTFQNERVAQMLAEVRAILDILFEENPATLGWSTPSLQAFTFAYRKLMLKVKKSSSAVKQLRQEQIRSPPNSSHRNCYYWCTMDLANCFTTINHDLMRRILDELVPPEREFTVIRVTVAHSKVKRRFQRWVAGNSFAHAMSRVRLKRYEYVYSNPIGARVTGADMQRRIVAFTLQTVIRRGGGVLFSCGRGIAQGNPISVKLCNLYLGAIERRLFPEPPRAVFCRRYVDDYLMIADDRRRLMECVKRFWTDGANYGVRLNADKIHFSFRNGGTISSLQLPGSKSVTKKQPRSSVARRRLKVISWCGFAFNTKNFNMAIDYQRYRATRPRFVVPSATAVHPADRPVFICRIVKRLLKPRQAAFRACARILATRRQRAAMRRAFSAFVYNHYLRYMAAEFRMELRRGRGGYQETRALLGQTVRWVSNAFRARSLPDVVKQNENF